MVRELLVDNELLAFRLMYIFDPEFIHSDDEHGGVPCYHEPTVVTYVIGADEKSRANAREAD